MSSVPEEMEVMEAALPICYARVPVRKLRKVTDSKQRNVRSGQHIQSFRKLHFPRLGGIEVGWV